MERSPDKIITPIISKKSMTSSFSTVRDLSVDVFLGNDTHRDAPKVQDAIDAGNVTINGKVHKASRKIQPGDVVQCRDEAAATELVPRIFRSDIDMKMNICSAVVNKPFWDVSRIPDSGIAMERHRASII